MISLDKRIAGVMGAVRRELKVKHAYVEPGMLRRIAASIKTRSFYSIKVLDNPEAAAEALRLRSQESCNFMAGSEGIQDFCKRTVFGQVQFGENYSCHNSTTGVQEDAIKDGKFDADRTFCFIKWVHEWCDLDGSSCNFNRRFPEIVIYAPKGKL